MNKKYLIALIFLVVTAHSASIAVGDSESYRQTSFYNVFTVPNVVLGETISVNMQWTTTTLQYKLSVYLYTDPAQKGAPKVCQSSPNTCAVSFDSDYTLTSGDFTLQLEYTNNNGDVVSPALPDNEIPISSLTVKGNAGTRTNPTILQQTIAFGPYRLHRVYFSTPTSLAISLPYSNIDQKNGYGADDFIRVFSEVSTGTFKLGGSKITRDSLNLGDDTNKVVTWTFPVGANYSWIVVDQSKTNLNLINNKPIYTYRLNYFTEVYTCPFLTDYPDTTGVFRGCVFQTDLSRLPCILYNSTVGLCQACYTGYSLVDGKCLENDCPAGQYKKYGQCLPNPTGCDTYNDFIKCTKCSTGFNLENGVCNKAPLTCTGRTFFNKTTWTCDKVDDKCREWAVDSGACTSCVNPAEKVVNGTCISAEKTCAENQFVNANLECVNIDPLCQTFEKLGGKCIKCVWGYEYNVIQAKCVKIVCPNRYVPNDYGKCARVSDLCDQYDAKGNCLACIPTHALQTDGVCLQIETPRPCPDRQYLGDDNFCHEVSDLCEIYNKDTGACTKCVSNYFLMYTGECVLQKQCKSRQILINNDCHDVSPTCGNFDRQTGKCLNCASADYELYYGLCIPVSTCGVRQWTDNNGKCFDVSPRCNTFNPSTGDCTSCVQGYNFLNGICCLKGQFNSNGKCIDAKDASQVSNQDGCRTYVNGIGCVRCDDGFIRSQDKFGFYFCQSA